MSDRAQVILAALGGAENLINVEACVTRMRVEVHDVRHVSTAALKAAGALAAIVSATGNVVQVVLGVETDAVVDEIAALGVARRFESR
ncbi:MAG: PTS transporter subunit EIIB [Buchananella hordeovulneris]|nr:PTS transporter subunit EIIB [Buchananella hordeovulneris]